MESLDLERLRQVTGGANLFVYNGMCDTDGCSKGAHYRCKFCGDEYCPDCFNALGAWKVMNTKKCGDGTHDFVWLHHDIYDNFLWAFGLR